MCPEATDRPARIPGVSSPVGRRLAFWGLLVLLAALLTTGGVLAAGLEASRRYAHALAYPGCRVPQRTPPEAGIVRYRDVTFSSRQGPAGLALKAWWVPSTNGAAVILLPGIGQARDGMLDQGAMLARHGYGVLLTDPRSCTDSPLAYTAGYAEIGDVAGALDFVQAQAGVDPDRIGILGYSAGGAAAILGAAQVKGIRAVVSEGNFYNLGDDIANSAGRSTPLEDFYQQAILFFYRRETGVDAHLISPIDAIGRISPRAVLLIFGEHEVASGHARDQFAAAGEPKALWILPGLGHGGYIQAQPAEYEARVAAFFDAALLSKP
jgi:dipeptidyl aminopeptidase/acylaminoacyl peptidase